MNTKDVGRALREPALVNEAPTGLRPSGFDPARVTFAACGGVKCDHDFFGPGSSERLFGGGGERVCGKCGAGAMQTDIWESE